jgi:hypothetical protein
MTFFDPPRSIEQTAYLLPHWPQGEVPIIVIFCLASLLLPWLLT